MSGMSHLTTSAESQCSNDRADLRFVFAGLWSIPGGIQEEAPSLGKPVLVMRDRPNGPKPFSPAPPDWWGPGVKVSSPNATDSWTIRRHTRPSRAHTTATDTPANASRRPSVNFWAASPPVNWWPTIAGHKVWAERYPFVRVIKSDLSGSIEFPHGASPVRGITHT